MSKMKWVHCILSRWLCDVWCWSRRKEKRSIFFVFLRYFFVFVSFFLILYVAFSGSKNAAWGKCPFCLFSWIHHVLNSFKSFKIMANSKNCRYVYNFPDSYVIRLVAKDSCFFFLFPFFFIRKFTMYLYQ